MNLSDELDPRETVAGDLDHAPVEHRQCPQCRRWFEGVNLIWIDGPYCSAWCRLEADRVTEEYELAVTDPRRA